MDKEQANRLIARGLFLDTLISSIEKALLTVGVSPAEVENFKSQLGGDGAASDGSAAAPAKKEKKTDKVFLSNGDEIDAEVKSDKTTAGRTRNYIQIGRKKVLLAKKGGRWQERAKAQRDFSGYVLTQEDADVVLALANLLEQGKSPNFMDIANSLGKSRGQLLGRYRNVSGSGYVAKDGNTYALTEKGRDFVASRTASAAPVKRKAKGARKTK